MTKSTSLATIELLNGQNPFPIKNLSLVGVKLTKGTTVGIIVTENSNRTQSVGLIFSKSRQGGGWQELMADEPADLTLLPPVPVTITAMAEALAHDSHCLSFQGLSAIVFAAAIASCAKVTIERYDDKDEDESLTALSCSIVAGEFEANTHLAPIEAFKQYVVLTKGRKRP